MEFYICEHCGNLVGMVKNTGVPIICCGQNMTKLVPGTSDGAAEKHVPVFTVDGNRVCVTVGEVEHPMLDAHYIEWIAIKTAKGAQRKTLQPGDAPKAEFLLTEDDTLEEVYAYCNLHSLWMAK